MSFSNLAFPQDERGQSRPGQEVSAARLLAVLRGSTDVFWVLTPACMITEVCPSWQTFTGQTPYDYFGRGWLDAIYPADQPEIEAALHQKTVASGQVAEVPCHIRRFDNVYRLFCARVIPVCAPDGILREIVVCGNDITASQMSAAQLQLAMQASGVGMWDANLVTGQLVATDQWKVLLGLPPDVPVTYERLLASVHPDDREKVDQFRKRAIAEKKDYHVDYRAIWPDGSLHWLTGRARGIYDVQDQPVHFMGALADITELKQAEERNAVILESITDAFVHIDTEWCFTYFNRRAEVLVGMKREEVLGQRLWDVFPELFSTPFEQQLRKAMETQQAVVFETARPWMQRYFEVHAYPTPDGLSLYLQDITERKYMEEALRESEVRLRRFVDSNIIGVMVSDLEGIIYEANDAFLSLIGYTQEDLVARRLRRSEITPPKYQARSVQAEREMLTTGAAPLFEKEYIAKDGRHVPVLVGGTLLHRNTSQPLFLIFILDLTAAKEIEHQKDLFLGMTSHELKTPLAALKGTMQLLQRRLKRQGTTDISSPMWDAFVKYLSQSLTDAVRQIDVQARLINDLLDVSRITANTLNLSLERCDLGCIVRETVEDLRVMDPERPLLLALPEHTVVSVLADRDRISQVLTNYITNALRYSSPDQPVQVGLTILTDVARVWVRDKGPGLSEDAQKEIWQCFHQIGGIPMQRGSGKGLGLGLYICQMLISQHQGEVGVESAPGEGSTFWFALSILK